MQRLEALPSLVKLDRYCPRGATRTCPPRASSGRKKPSFWSAEVVSVSKRSAMSGAEVIEGMARVLDGDTVEVEGVRIRFFGVDAPEWDQKMLKGGVEYPCGQIAKRELADRIGGEPVRCEVHDVDHYGRKVAVVWSRGGQGEDLNAYMVRNGFVMAFTKITDRYVELEQEARAARRGIWDGQCMEPAQYRRLKSSKESLEGAGSRRSMEAREEQQHPQRWRSDADAPLTPAKPAPRTRNGPPDPSRPIKGSKNSRGKRIYHMPGSAAYEDVEIDEREGERWFASAEEAERAGWQPTGGGR